MSPAPPITDASRVSNMMRTRGWAAMDARGMNDLGVDVDALTALAPSWNDLPLDAWLKDGGKYRARRHSCFVVTATASHDTREVQRVAHRAHWQSAEYNALHGGIERWFEPMRDAVVHTRGWTQLLLRLGAMFDAVAPAAVPHGSRWFVEAHQFRIDTREGIGRPTPEGAHRDGVDFVALFLVAREGIKGGETRVFDAHGPDGVRFTLVEPWSALLLDDARVIHETTPIQPAAPNLGGHRDTLVLTYRRDGFQSR
jgi:hypothetical protein